MVFDITMENLTPEKLPRDENMHVVMFFGPTCGPCKATMPFYEEAANFYVDAGAHIKFYRIDAWNPPEQKQFCTDVWGVQGVPHFKAFYGGVEIKNRVGGGDLEVMKQFIHEGIDEIFKQHNARI
jgi:thiol-disulfide isomerase/thioredoxin